jgi:hypothetical protein
MLGIPPGHRANQQLKILSRQRFCKALIKYLARCKRIGRKKIPARAMHHHDASLPAHRLYQGNFSLLRPEKNQPS